MTVVQSRIGSTRLPGKVLRLAGGRPLLELQLLRMERSRLAGTIVVATTTSPNDDSIVDLTKRLGFRVTRGSELDLLARHLQAAEEHHADVVVKVPSDCPLVDPRVIDRTIASFLECRPDYASNLHPPSWPDGQDVEVVSIGALHEAHRKAGAPWEREHTTPYLWERPDRFSLLNVAWERDLSRSLRLTVDYPEDLELVDAIVTRLHPLAPIDEIVELLERNRDLADLNAAFRGVNWYRHHLADLRTIDARDTALPPVEVAS